MTYGHRPKRLLLFALSLFILSCITASTTFAQNTIQLPIQLGPGEPIIIEFSGDAQTDITGGIHIDGDVTIIDVPVLGELVLGEAELDILFDATNSDLITSVCGEARVPVDQLFPDQVTVLNPKVQFGMASGAVLNSSDPTSCGVSVDLGLLLAEETTYFYFNIFAELFLQFPPFVAQWGTTGTAVLDPNDPFIFITTNAATFNDTEGQPFPTNDFGLGFSLNGNIPFTALSDNFEDEILARLQGVDSFKTEFTGHALLSGEIPVPNLPIAIDGYTVFRADTSVSTPPLTGCNLQPAPGLGGALLATPCLIGANGISVLTFPLVDKGPFKALSFRITIADGTLISEVQPDTFPPSAWAYLNGTIAPDVSWIPPIVPIIPQQSAQVAAYISTDVTDSFLIAHSQYGLVPTEFGQILGLSDDLLSLEADLQVDFDSFYLRGMTTADLGILDINGEAELEALVAANIRESFLRLRAQAQLISLLLNGAFKLSEDGLLVEAAILNSDGSPTGYEIYALLPPDSLLLLGDLLLPFSLTEALQDAADYISDLKGSIDEAVDYLDSFDASAFCDSILAALDTVPTTVGNFAVDLAPDAVDGVARSIGEGIGNGIVAPIRLAITAVCDSLPASYSAAMGDAYQMQAFADVINTLIQYSSITVNENITIDNPIPGLPDISFDINFTIDLLNANQKAALQEANTYVAYLDQFTTDQITTINNQHQAISRIIPLPGSIADIAGWRTMSSIPAIQDSDFSLLLETGNPMQVNMTLSDGSSLPLSLDTAAFASWSTEVGLTFAERRAAQMPEQVISHLEVIDDPVGFVLPTFNFVLPVDESDNPVPAEWFNLVIATADDEIILDKWYPTDLYCIDVYCSITLTLADLPAGLLSGSYKWAVRTWHSDTDVTALSDTVSFEVTTTAPGIPQDVGVETSSTPAQLYFAADPLAAWYHIVIVDGEGGLAYDNWHSINELDCSSTPDYCIFVIKLNPDQGALVNGSYDMYVQAWGPGGMSDYSAAAPFTLDEPVPDLPVFSAAHAITHTDTGSPTFSWTPGAVASWQQIWIGTPEGATVHMGWYAVHDMDCPTGQGDTCTFIPQDIYLSNGSYDFWVRAWSPGGYSTAGENAGWIHGTPFTVNAQEPSPPEGVTVTGLPDTGTIEFWWQHVEDVTWYQVWIGSQQGTTYTQYHLQWYRASEIGCLEPSQLGYCGINPAGLYLPEGDYLIYIQSYSPGWVNDNSLNYWTNPPESFNVDR